jgi:signal peptidase I
MKNDDSSRMQYEFDEFIKNDEDVLDSMVKTISVERRKRHSRSETFAWVRSFAFAIAVVLLVRGFIGEPVRVFGSSMEETLHEDDVLIMSKITLRTVGIKVGDIVVIEIEPVTFKYLHFLDDVVWFRRMFPTQNREDYIKRVIALEGDTVDIWDGRVYVNSKLLDEPYVSDGNLTYERYIEMPYTVPEGYIFVMGDNRLVSKDSRSLGAFSIDSIIGIIVYRTWPLTKIGTLE